MAGMHSGNCAPSQLKKKARRLFSPGSLCRQLYLATRTVFNPDWCSQKSEGLADLVFQKTLVGEVQLHVLIGKENKGRRRGLGLGHIVDSDFLPVRHGCALEIDSLKKAIHLRGADPFAPFSGDQFYSLEHFVQILASAGCDKQDRSIIKKFQAPPYLLLINIAVGRWVPILTSGTHQVPFVYNDDHRSAALVGVAADVGIQR